jgi:HK97 family phage major capsid protein
MRVRNQSGRSVVPWAVLAPDGGGGAADLKAMKDVLADLGPAVKQVSDDLKKISSTYTAEIKNLGDATRETKAAADKALSEAVDIRAQHKAIEQSIARLQEGGQSEERPKSPGYQVIESEEGKALAGKKGRFSVVVKVKNMITSATTDADGSAGDLVVVDRRPGIVAPAQRRMTIRSLLAPGRTSSNMIEYVQETGFTNNAQTQDAEGSPKGESTMKFDLQHSPVVTIAHFVRASKQILDDASMLQSYIDQRLRYGLMYEEERQILSGDGSGGDLDGLIQAATAYDPAFSPDFPSPIDVLRLAMLQAELAEWPATGHVMNPKSWARIELTKDQEGRYIFANPTSLRGPSLWGLPVVTTQAMIDTKFMTGAFVPAAQLFDREDANVQISTEDADNFTKNLVTIRAEERLGLAIYRREALIYGDLSEES